MFARVLRLREMGALITDPQPPEEQWPMGIFEMQRDRKAKRLVLRDGRASPGNGLLFELFEPAIVDVTLFWLRIRGIETVSLGNGHKAAVVQEWLVRLL